MKLTVIQKLSILFLVALVCLAAIGFGFYRQNTELFTSPDLPSANESVLVDLDHVRTGLKIIASIEPSFISNPQESERQTHSDAIKKIRSSLASLKAVFTFGSPMGDAFDKLNFRISQRLQFSERVIEARHQMGQRTAEQVLGAGRDRLIDNEIDLRIAELERDIIGLIARQNQLLGREIRASAPLLFAGYLVSFGVMILALLLIRRESSRFRQADRELAENQKRLRVLAEAIKDAAMFILDRRGIITEWGLGSEQLLGYREQEVLGKDASLLLPEERRGEGFEHLIAAAETDGRSEAIRWHLRADGTAFQAHDVVTFLKDDEGEPLGFAIVSRNITEQRRSEELLARLSQSVEQATDLIIIMDRQGRVEYLNKATETVTGFAREEFLDKGLELLVSEHRDSKPHQQMWDTVLAGFSFQTETAIKKKNGEVLYLDEVVTPIIDGDGAVTHVVFTASDITHEKDLREKIEFISSYDSVTGLPNRNVFAERLSRDLTQPGRKTFAVLAIDIDRFKFINEIYGLEAGNSVLKQVAESLSVSVSKGDTVARLGSDEFGIILHDIARPADAVLFVKMIMKNVPQIVMSGGEEVSVTLAIGIAVHPDDGGDALTLMKRADIALSRAKSLGRNNYQFYTSDMNVGASELMFMERRLVDALQNQEYVLSYQPYVDMTTKRVAGSEALIKWKNEEYGLVSPSKFIPMLEETGMIIDVGKWVLRTACEQLQVWGSGKSHLPVSVNLSLSQFHHDDLVETVDSTIQEFRIDPRRLTLEVTESIFMKDLDFAISVLQRLKLLGVSIAIDDFGTGYSSLSYLKKFPVDAVKIDQSFVKDVTVDPDTTSLVMAIINMAHSLNLKTIAEGVETEEQWKILRLLKCDLGQGYYFSPALSPSEFEKFLA